MINEENLKNEVLNELQTIADDGYYRFSEKLEKEIELIFSEISNSLEKEFKNTYNRYRKLEEAGGVGKLKWIYLSFLRTSFLDHSPCYQIDFYDSRDRISEIECVGSWDFKYVFDCYYNVEKEIIDRLNKQTRLKKYEINGILLNLQQRFHRLADTRIPPIIKNILKENKEIFLNENDVKFMLGEYLDQSELIAEYRVEKE